jgi:hypothetical protein
MGALVKNKEMKREELVKNLREVTKILQQGIIKHFNKNLDNDTFETLWGQVGLDEHDFIDKRKENFTEVLNQFKHISVILKYLENLKGNEMISIHPTQTHKKGQCDIMGPDFAVEAYGGKNFKNNNKLPGSIKNLGQSGKKKKLLVMFNKCDVQNYLWKNENEIHEKGKLKFKSKLLKDQVYDELKVFEIQLVEL